MIELLVMLVLKRVFLTRKIQTDCRLCPQRLQVWCYNVNSRNFFNVPIISGVLRKFIPIRFRFFLRSAPPWFVLVFFVSCTSFVSFESCAIAKRKCSSVILAEKAKQIKNTLLLLLLRLVPHCPRTENR